MAFMAPSSSIHDRALDSPLEVAARLAPVDESKSNVLAMKAEVASASAAQTSVGLTAWKLRNAEMFMRDIPKDFRMTKPDGTKMDWKQLFDLQKVRMAAIKHIDHLFVTITVESVNATDAVVLSTQDWSRVRPGTDNKDTRIVTSVTHREIWQKGHGKWKMIRFTEENQKNEVASDASVTDPIEHFEIRIVVSDRSEQRDSATPKHPAP